MKKRLVWVGGVLAGMLATACQTAKWTEPDEPVRSKDKPTLAELIEYSGHGQLFDRNFKPIDLNNELRFEMQDAMISAILKDKEMDPSGETLEIIAQAQKVLRNEKLELEESLILQSGIITRLLYDAPYRLRVRYEWRHRILFDRSSRLIYPKVLLRPRIVELLHPLRIFEFLEELLTGGNTDYMDDCRAHKVPVPPNWAESGTAWKYQGTLAQNLLTPGAHAEVWTYEDPNNRGACVALPRDSGAVGSPAGIICQSATTGHACFWDNKLRGQPEQFIGWKNKTLIIADLKDGSNLNDNCPRCHLGNNVYLISPDDSTWAKLLRGSLSSTPGSKFTTRVESSSDNQGGNPRYIPISTLPPRPGWINAFSGAQGCSGACHEPPAIANSPPMPPACDSTATGCYDPP